MIRLFTKSLLVFAVIVAALINSVACQDITFRTKETDEPASIAFKEKTPEPTPAIDVSDETVTQAAVAEPEQTQTETQSVQTSSTNSKPEEKPVAAPSPKADTVPSASPPAQDPKPAPEANAGKKFVTTCTCGATFSDANEWRAHRNSFKEKWFSEEIADAEMNMHNGYSQSWQ
jgi:outer membrane biosynthesis protein TonB